MRASRALSHLAGALAAAWLAHPTSEALSRSSAAGPRPGALKAFADWIVGCDNGLACQANALAPDAGADDYLMLLVRRDGALGAAAFLIAPRPERAPKGGALTLRVDGAPVSTLAWTDEAFKVALGQPLASALANGAKATITDASGKTLTSASLAGLAAALLYIDDQQHRVGTTHALRRPGARELTEAPPPLPIVATPPAADAPPKTLSVAAATELIGPDNAKCDYAGEPVKPEAARLDAQHSLSLVNHPCGNGAYNLFRSAYILNEACRATLAGFDANPGLGEDDQDAAAGDQIVNADWDRKTRRLSTYAKGRGLGDCGSTQSYVWDGQRFRLVAQAEMDGCRGSIDYITTWRATVQTRAP